MIPLNEEATAYLDESYAILLNTLKEITSKMKQDKRIPSNSQGHIFVMLVRALGEDIIEKNKKDRKMYIRIANTLIISMINEEEK